MFMNADRYLNLVNSEKTEKLKNIQCDSKLISASNRYEEEVEEAIQKEKSEKIENIQYDSSVISACNRYEEAIQQETKLILNTRYDLDQLYFCIYFIECGLSPARNFQPVIRINTGCNQHISFTLYEWTEFIRTLISITEEEDKEKEITTSFWENFTINVVPVDVLMDRKIRRITLTKNSINLLLMDADVLEILRMNTVLTSKLYMLHKLDFFVYYYNVLKSVNQIMIENNYNNLSVIDIAKIVCNSNNSIENYCMQECLFYCSEQVLVDFNTYQINF